MSLFSRVSHALRPWSEPGVGNSNYDGLERAVGPVVVGSTVPSASGTFWGWVRDSFPGAWQKGITPDQPQNLLAFSAVYSCVTLIANDVAKLRPRLMEEGNGGIWTEVKRNSPLAAVLVKPNRYQTTIQFLQQWLASKLMHGNAYALKERDNRRVVTGLYILNPFYVKPLIATDGSVWYQINRDWLAGLQNDITVPASEMIHDRCPSLWHPLVGVSPLYACGATATQGIRIQGNSKRFFENMSMPSGQLTSGNKIDDVTALRLKKEFEENFGGGQLGRIFVGGLGLKFEPITMPAQLAQLVEQLKWTVEDVARGFSVPLYKLGGSLPASFNSVAALNQDYYSQTLQIYIEALEACLVEGLELTKTAPPYAIKFDLEGLLRMDPLARAETDAKEVTAGILAPNEGRAKRNLPPVEGGDTPYMQEQNYSLKALAKRDTAPTKPTLPAPPPVAPAPVPPPPAPNKEGGNVIEGEFTDISALADQFDALAREAPLFLEAA